MYHVERLFNLEQRIVTRLNASNKSFLFKLIQCIYNFKECLVILLNNR